MFAAFKMVFVFIALGIPAWVFGMPWTLLTKSVDRMYIWGRQVAALGVRAAGIRVKVFGLENIPAEPCLFMSNHCSNLDPPILIPVIPRLPSVMVKKALMSLPLLGSAMKIGKFVPVERDSRAGAVHAMRAGLEAVRSGRSMGIFAEGTRSRTGRLLPFKKGLFHLAQSTGAPIVPVVLLGTEAMMGKGGWRVSSGVAEVRFLEAVETAAFPKREDLMAEVRRRMVEALPEHMRPLE